MAVITGADLASYPGITGEAGSLDALAEMASDLIEEAWTTPIEPTPVWVKNIALGAAARAQWNPKGLEMLSRQIDDAKRTETFSKANAGMVGVYLTSEERVLLGGAARSAGVGSIRTRPAPYSQSGW